MGTMKQGYNFSSILDPALDRRYEEEVTPEIERRLSTRLQALRPQLARQEGAVGGRVGGGTGQQGFGVRGTDLARRAALQAGLAEALGSLVSGESARSGAEAGQARQQFFAARAQELARKRAGEQATLNAATSLAGLGAKLGLRIGGDRLGYDANITPEERAMRQRERDLYKSEVDEQRQIQLLQHMADVYGGQR